MAMTTLRVPILMYHSIAEPSDARERSICLPLSEFERQMEFLREDEYTPVSLDLLAEVAAGKGVLPFRPVVITFDDGYADNFAAAFPILQRCGFPATVFLVTGCVGGTNAWDVACGGPERWLLTWDNVAEMLRGGVTFGSHTVSHRRLTELAPADALTEMRESKRVMEERLEVPVRHFSYPYGEMNEAVVALVREAGYLTACTTMSGFNGADINHLALRRLDIYGTDTLPRFIRKLAYGNNDGSIMTSLRYYGRRLLERAGGGLMTAMSIILAAVFVGNVVFGAEEKAASTVRKEKDSAGREWTLKEWGYKEERPYPKSLAEREKWYRVRWGESWYGPKSTCRILSPGTWKWEEVFRVPDSLAEQISSKGKKTHGDILRRWGARFWGMCFVWAPGGGEVTDVYALADEAIIHYDPTSKKLSVIGKPRERGDTDGVGEDARLVLGAKSALDPVTGRLYFIQGKKWRYVEKLLPYRCLKTGLVFHLPAVLDWNSMYRKVKSPAGGELEIAPAKDGRRAPLFVVRTEGDVKNVNLPGPGLVGRRPLIAPNGKSAWFSDREAYEENNAFQSLALYDLQSGSLLRRLTLDGVVPKNFRTGSDGPGSHGGTCVGAEGDIFNAQHGGCCGPCGSSPGRMQSIDTGTGKVVTLYDSMAADGSWQKATTGAAWNRHQDTVLIDGPADARSLLFTSTLWQTQCPRTGAIYNGGWDHSGIRRYHDGFVTSFLDSEEEHRWPPRPGWKFDSHFYHGNSSPSVAPNGDLYISDDNYKVPRVVRFYRTDWPKEQPVNSYAEKFLPRAKMENLMVEYAEKYLADFAANNKLVER
ncbi:MAG: polysaccharide [Geobacteraceae bacterium]|nr:MAG: polysaccharide [Geobacteraceae bacterium]